MGMQKDKDNVIWEARKNAKSATVSQASGQWKGLVAHEEPRYNLDDPGVGFRDHEQVRRPRLQSRGELVDRDHAQGLV